MKINRTAMVDLIQVKTGLYALRLLTFYPVLDTIWPEKHL